MASKINNRPITSVLWRSLYFFHNVKSKYKKNLKEKGVETSEATKNLKRNCTEVQRNCAGTCFLLADVENIICSKNITTEDIFSLFYKKKIVDQLKNIEENICSLAVAICKEP